MVAWGKEEEKRQCETHKSFTHKPLSNLTETFLEQRLHPDIFQFSQLFQQALVVIGYVIWATKFNMFNLFGTSLDAGGFRFMGGYV